MIPHSIVGVLAEEECGLGLSVVGQLGGEVYHKGVTRHIFHLSHLSVLLNMLNLGNSNRNYNKLSLVSYFNKRNNSRTSDTIGNCSTSFDCIQGKSCY